MAHDPRYDILFEPVRIGPVTAPNRFMQAPHCNGMGRMFPDSMIAMRGMKAKGGWDIVVVYAGHDGTMPSHFLSRRHNQRGDEYGGSLENRLRLYRELLEDTLDAVGDSMGVIARFAVDEMMGPDGLE